MANGASSRWGPGSGTPAGRAEAAGAATQRSWLAGGHGRVERSTRRFQTGGGLQTWTKYIYIYIYLYVYISIYIHMYTHECMNIYIYIIAWVLST